MAADLPSNYEGHPAFQFILDVPTDWEETIVLNGEIGKYITTVRKDINSDDWFLGSITNEDSRVLNINLSFLEDGEEYNGTIYKDVLNGGWLNSPEEIEIETLLFTNKDSHEIVLPEGTTNPDGTFTQNGNISVSNIKEGAFWEYRLDSTLPWKSDGLPGENPSEGKIVITEDGDYQIDVRVINAQGESTSLDSPVSISVDNMPPTAEFVSADSEAGTISINYNESLDPVYLPLTSDFDITQNGNELNVVSVAVNDNILVLSVNESFSAGALNFTYEASIDVNEQLTDLAGNKVEQGFTQMIVSDGYIRGAQVYIDVNGDGIADESELREQVTSDAFGQIILTDEFLNAAENIDSNGNPYQVIVKGGVNMDSGAPNEIELTAPAGYSVINPLSTLVQEIASSLEVEVNTEGLSEEEIVLATQAAKDAAKLTAESSLAETLGISLEEGSSLGSYDPQSDNNVANRVIATQIATVLAVASSTETTGSEGAETAALSSLANTISSAEGTVTLDSSTMGEVLDGVVDDTAALDALNLAVDAMEAVKNSEDSDAAFAAIVQAQAKAIDTVAPQAPQPELSAAYDSGISDSDALTNVNNPVVRFVLDTLSTDGTAVVAGDKLEILNTGVSQGVFVLTAQHIEDGYYDYTWVGELLDGDRFISATVTDLAGNLSYVSTFVFEVDTAPLVITSDESANIDENSDADQIVYTATTAGLDFWKFELSSDSDPALMIDAQTGVVTLSADPDFEAQSQYSFTVIAFDNAGNTSDKTVALNINNLDEVAPTVTSGDTAVAIDENSGASQVIYTATADDTADISDGFTFSLAEGSDAALSIDSVTGEVSLATDPDHETQSQYSFAVIATDAAGNASAEQAVTLDIADLDDTAPTITSAVTAEAIDENSGAGQVVYTVTADDSADVADTPIAYSLAEGSDAALTIDSATGAVTLTTDPDHESQSQYSFAVIATDAAGNASEAQSVTLDINDLDDTAPIVTSGDTAVALDENSDAAEVIYTATADDSADVTDGVTFSLNDTTAYPEAALVPGVSTVTIPELAAATQHVYVSSSTKSEDGTQETVVVSYNADDTTTTGLGLRIHFDSSALSASDIATLMTNDLLVNAVVESDDNDLDGDASTDTYVAFGWASLFGQWPNAAPVDLASITFNIAEGATGSSAINFSISSNAAGFAFDGQDHNLVLAAEVVVPAAELVIDNAAGTVSLDATVNTVVDYSFRVEGTDAQGNAIGSQTVPVVVVDQIVNADASSYTGTADEDVFALADGSAEITSGAGEDEFIFDPAFASATHTITDFESGVDTIDISAALVAAGYNTSDNAPTQLASTEMSADILDLVNGDDSSLDNLFGATYDDASNTLTVFADSDSSTGSTDMDSFQITLDDSATVEDDDIVANLSTFIA